MTTRIIGLALYCCIHISSAAADHWKPVENSMLTTWGEQLDPDEVWQEYPRPQLERETWKNLNGLWKYAVTPKDAGKPSEWTGDILVPFAIEAPLSGVGHRLQPDEALWYTRSFELMKMPEGRLLLNFEAVDYASEVWVNGKAVGKHIGGSLPFTFDVTNVAKSGANELLVKVLDATDEQGTFQLRGKQTQDLDRRIFYTPVSGIWQTVWLELVPENYIRNLKIDTDLAGKITIAPDLVGSGSLRSTAYFGGRKVAAGGNTLAIPSPKLWSPSSPSLYNLKIELLGPDGQVMDTVKSYTGIRKVGKVKDKDGNWRMILNGEVIFHYGPLDQGWWPDGLLTPPSENAMLSDMKYLKEAGFNTIRKHIKIEPRRYYYHCDRMGFLVWQDHLSGGKSQKNQEWPKWRRLRDEKDFKLPADDKIPRDGKWPKWAHEQSMAELKGMIDTLRNHPSIVLWTVFNERWGQHETMKFGKWITEYDPSRTINIGSGGNFFPVGDVADEHRYPAPGFMMDFPVFKDYVKVVSEFGGHGWKVKGHLWSRTKKSWGYGGAPENMDEYFQRYAKSARILAKLEKEGLAAGIYTQTSDVEGEINGLMTYDRRVIKIPAARLKTLHEELGF